MSTDCMQGLLNADRPIARHGLVQRDMLPRLTFLTHTCARAHARYIVNLAYLVPSYSSASAPARSPQPSLMLSKRSPMFHALRSAKSDVCGNN
jgi:hypothetical protein